jgi:tripartite motif-containing protein 2/3/tripartite motif-containing protein 71
MWSTPVTIVFKYLIHLQQFGKTGKDDGELDTPTDIHIDSDNIMYVTEGHNYRISLFTLEGEFLTSFGSEGDGPGQLNYVTLLHPREITGDKQGTIYTCC